MLICGVLGVLFGIFLAYANGANDNFKGVATLYGSRTTSFRGALAWATLATAAGCMAAAYLAQGLAARFSGKGLVPDPVLASHSFLPAVALAAAATVMLATRLGLPVSTTHALTGALAGAGILASASGIDVHKLLLGFLAPLLIGPVVAMIAMVVSYPALRACRRWARTGCGLCVCIGSRIVAALPQRAAAEGLMSAAAIPIVTVGEDAACVKAGQRRLFGVTSESGLDALHYLSAGLVSFARGLNDTPKIAAVLLTGSALGASAAIPVVTIAMAIGGFLSARRVAETMSHRVTPMGSGQGFTANLITGGLVSSASVLGLPLSTTHVSCGTLFGLGVVTGQARWKTIGGILAAWVTTLPLAAVLGMLFLLLLRGIGG